MTEAIDRDAILMEVAGWIEEGDISSLPGILNKRKRVREDAALRIQTSKEVRARMARMIRGRMENKVGDPVDFLKDVQAGDHDRHYTGFTLRQAIALADRGLLTVVAMTQVAGPWNNTVGGKTEYQIRLTEKGEKFIADADEPVAQQVPA
jgi:hypothetical protein